MDISQLRSFVEIARHGSFSAAARALGLTQPAISRQLKQLERGLGVALVDREQRPVALTPAGKDFLPCAEMIMKQLEVAIQQLAVAGSAPAGPVVVAASTIPGEYLVPGILARFSMLFSHVRPDLIITDSAGVVEALLSGKAEIGFLGAPMVNRRLHLIPFTEDEIVLMIPADHPFAEKRAVPLADLAGQSFVERSGGSGTLESLRRILAQHGQLLPQHRVVMIAGTSQAQLAAIEAGVGLGFVSKLALANRSLPRVVAVEIEGMELRRTLYLAYGRAPLSSAAQALVDFVIEYKGQ